MKTLHTSDWHAGKKLRSFSRLEELQGTIEEMVRLVEEHDIDLVLFAGDLFDVKKPDSDAMRVAFNGLSALTLGGKVPVVAISGNHDDANAIEDFVGLMELHNVHLVGSVKPPDRSWVKYNSRQVPVVVVETKNGQPAAIGAVPFLRETQLFHAFDSHPNLKKGKYAEQMRSICAEYSEAAIETASSLGGKSFLMGHFLISGSRVLGGSQRGERALDMRDAYATTPQSVATGVDYVAMGHVHAPQDLPGVHAPGTYSGSPIQMDFGERHEEKRAVICDTTRTVAEITSVPLKSGRRLERVRLQWGETAPDETRECYVDAEIVHQREVSIAEMREWAVDHFPWLAQVIFEERNTSKNGHANQVSADKKNRSVTDLWVEYHQFVEGAAPPDEWVGAMRELETEASV